MSTPTPRTKRAHYDSMMMWERGQFQEAVAHTVKISADIERDLIAARTLINRGVELMTPDQVGQWEGVRAWLEQTR